MGTRYYMKSFWLPILKNEDLTYKATNFSTYITEMILAYSHLQNMVNKELRRNSGAIVNSIDQEILEKEYLFRNISYEFRDQMDYAAKICNDHIEEIRWQYVTAHIEVNDLEVKD